MAETKHWSLPPPLRPKPELLSYDIAAALQAMVLLRSEAPADAFTAGVLGTDRLGHGVVIQNGERKVILTIGYLLAEVESIWITSNSGQVVAGHALAYDYATGLGLVQPLGTLNAPVLQRGSATALSPGDELTVLAHGGLEHALATRLVARKEFAGYWEYLLEEALYTSPAHPLWGGTALVDAEGLLVGIGSLFIQESRGGMANDSNMYVPIDVLEPILGELLQYGAVRRPARPWLGLYTNDDAGRLVVAGLVAQGPAHASGVSLGDAIVAVAGEPVQTLAQFYRAVWGQGNSGVKVRITVQRAGDELELLVTSASREQFLKQPARH